MFVIGSLWVFASSVSATAQGIVQGMKKYVSLAKILTISKVIMVIFTIVGLELNHTPSIGVVSWLVFNGAIIIGCNAFFGRKLRHVKSTYKPYSMILKYSFPLGLASILTTMFANADLVIVGGYLHLVFLAIYNLAVKISLALTLVVILPLTTSLLPEIASLSGG